MTATDGAPADTREMYMAHDMLRREFTLMPALVRGVAVGDTARAGVIAGHLDFVTTVLHHHHHGEDVHLWPKLLARGPTDIGPIVHVMESQHGGIEETLREIEGVVGPWRETASPRSTEDLALILERMDVLLREHLAMEEQRVLPLVEKWVTAREWDEMVQAEAADTPQERVPLLFGMMLYEGDPDVIEKALSQMPADVRPVVREMSLEAFASHSEQVHGTATPRRGKA